MGDLEILQILVSQSFFQNVRDRETSDMFCLGLSQLSLSVTGRSRNVCSVALSREVPATWGRHPLAKEDLFARLSALLPRLLQSSPHRDLSTCSWCFDFEMHHRWSGSERVEEDQDAWRAFLRGIGRHVSPVLGGSIS